MSEMKIAVVGASGLIGRQIVAALAEREHDAAAVHLFGTERSNGEELDFEDDVLTIETMGPDSFRGIKVVILAVPPSAARLLASQAQQAGAWVVDCSGAFRLDPGVPLVVPGVNDTVLDTPFSGRVVSLASPVTQALASVLEPLRVKFGLTFADVTVLQGASSSGQQGVDRLAKQAAELMNGKEPEVEVFPHRLGFNVIPAVGEFDAKGFSQDERNLMVETARLWAGPELPAVTTTSLLVPTYHGTMLIVSAHLRRPVDADGVRAVLKEESDLKVIDAPEQNVYPMPMLTSNDDTVHVGRIRALGERVQLIIAVDNVQRMAARAIDVALELGDAKH